MTTWYQTDNKLVDLGKAVVISTMPSDNDKFVIAVQWPTENRYHSATDYIFGGTYAECDDELELIRTRLEASAGSMIMRRERASRA